MPSLLSAFRSPRRAWTDVSLGAKMSLLVAAGLIALVAIFCILAGSAAREASDRALQERVALAQMAAGHLDHVLGDLDGALLAAAGHLAAPGAAPDTVLRELMTGSAPAFRQALLVDAAGVVLAAYPPLTEPLALSEPAARQVRSGGFALADLTLPGGGAGLAAYAPVPGRAAADPQSVLAVLDLTWPGMAGFMQSLALGQTGYLEVVDQRGTVLLSSREARVLTQADHDGSLARMVSAGRSTASTCHSCHESAEDPRVEPEVLAFAPLKRATWGVVVRQAESEAFAASAQLQGRIVLLGVISVLGAMALLWLTTRSLILPVQHLTAAAARIAGGDLYTPVATRGSDEIARLSVTLDDMRQRMSANMAEIKTLNRDLDRRVQERTRQCVLAQEALTQRNRELSIVNAVATAMTQPLLLDELLGKVLDEVLRVTGIAVGAVFLAENEAGSLALKVYRGTSEEAAQAMIDLHMGDGACGGVMERGEPVVVPDLCHYRVGAGGLLRKAGLSSLVHVPLITRGLALGTMCVASLTLRDFHEEEVDLLMSVGSQIALGIENARLYGEIAHREQLRGELLQKLITAQEDERKRIARDLHDDTSQSITALIYSLEAAEVKCAAPDTRPALTAMRQLATQTLEGIHKLIFDLRPSMLDHLGLPVAMRWYAETRLEPGGIRVHFEEEGSSGRLPAQLETALFRVAQEAINNIGRHSGARNVTVTFKQDEGSVAIELQDDGIGFDPTEVSRATDQSRGLGLVGMEERVGLLGGHIEIASEAGRGTRVFIQAPVGAPQPVVPAYQEAR